ncbi:LacI family transcriptional regulator [Paenibacillus marchantiophytorum]|uniref:LacI family transcriptional regulator n=1 Tax=Paenibacillus marchantiophytorum TaxID=1619310 RepID=A0ABQ2BP71_9BACL|nr:LacI family DNA-binding transcriptional regulator [Paenibacillus marchantiophytorum]GGI44293.1 LacI family transcriptional regulator [Paenibacillus marchantiophytorum]
MVTRKDVAERAGVSVAVVSYVMNNKTNVKETTRNKVLAVIQELDYRPNLVARSMKTKKTQQLAVLVNNLGNPFEAGILISLERSAMERGYFLFFQKFQPQQEESLKSLFAGRVDGIILLGQSLAMTTIEYFQQQGIPVISIMEPSSNEKGIVPFLDIDWASAMKQLFVHLKSRGYRSIAYLTAGQQMSSQHYEVRNRALIHAAGEEDIQLDELIEVDSCNFETAYRHLVAKWTSQSDFSYQALLCVNDLTAAGAVAACKQLGISVPERLAIVGCEDILMSSQTSPTITTIHYPRLAIGEATLERMLALIQGQAVKNEILKNELVVREST